MKLAHVLIPDVPVQVEILGDAGLRHRPVVIGGQPDEHGPVIACSPAAQREGVRIGMPLRQAQQLSPGAVFLPNDGARYERAHRALVASLSAFSPLRETLAPGIVYLDASGLEGLYGPDRKLVERMCLTIQKETGLQAKIGLASTKFTAATAAGLARLGTGLVVQPGLESAFLAPLPIGVLPISEEAYQLLTRLGLTALGQVAGMPAGALSRTLGVEGEELHRLACGIDPRPLLPQFEEAPLSAEVHLDFQLEQLPALVAYADLLASQLASELQRAGLAAGNVILEVEQETGERLTTWGYLRPASSDRRRISERVAGLLERQEYTGGASGLKLALTPLLPAHQGSRQMPFQHGYALIPDPVGSALRSIRDRYGGSAIQAAATVSGPPPEPVEVRLSDQGKPGALLQGRTWRPIESVQLHWRMEGDWWFQQGRRDYFQVVTRRGEILVLLHATPEDRWYLHPAAKPTQWPVM
jgi:DNA polymerase-4